MKVLHVIPSVSGRSGGPGQAIIPMCRALQEQGIEVLIATTNHGLNGERVSLGVSEGYKGIPTIFFPVQWGDSFKYSGQLSVWLNANVKRFDVVHIHAVFNHACIAAANACRKHEVPYIVRPLGTLDPWSMNQKSLRKRVFWRAGFRKMLANAAAIHYTAEGEQRAVEESLNLNHGVVVPLGVEPRPLEDSPGAKTFSGPIPRIGSGPYVLVLSRLHPKKALDVLLEAFLPLVQKPEFQSWRLVLAGEGPAAYVASLKQTVAARLATESVLFPGWLDGEEKETTLRHALLLALPSYQENFGLCVMESLAYGVPVLISPHVNLAPEIKTAGAGWIAAVDRDSLSAALAEALGSEKERLRRGEAGRNLTTRFTWSAIAIRLFALYSSVLPAGHQSEQTKL